MKNIWYPDILKFGEKYKILAVVGNKCDRFEEENIVSEEEAREFAKEIKANFFMVSAKNGTNINPLFENLIELYIQPHFQDKISPDFLPRRGSQRIKKPEKDEENTNNSERKKCC